MCRHLRTDKAPERSPKAHHGYHRPPPIRAYIFDLDGLLIDSEDIISQGTNELLEKYGRPPLTQSMRARMMVVSGSTSSGVFHDWVRLPISRDTWAVELREKMRERFPDCEPLPGAEDCFTADDRAQCFWGPN